ncbi:hypothetical protein KC345_g9728, partial [Hortaea werneckii]
MEINWTDFFAPVWLSVKISVITSIIVFLLATLAARKMAGRKFFGHSLIETILLLPLVLPPTVVGFVLLVILGRRSWIGKLYEQFTEHTILFTWGAAVIAAVVVAFPLVYRTVKAGFEGVEKDLEDSARAQGASEFQVLRYVTLPLASRSLAAGYVLGFARGLGEFGATIMVAGNIPGRTQTVPTAIYVAVDGGNMTLAWMWALQIIQDDLAAVTDMAVLTVDSAGKPVTRHSKCTDFCRAMRSATQSSRLCESCDYRGGNVAQSMQRPYVYKCHMGIVDMAVPLVVDNKYLGSIMLGQISIPGQDARNELEMLNPGVSSGRICLPGKVLVIPAATRQEEVYLRGEYGPADVEADTARLVNKYSFLSMETIGNSVLGKPIRLLRIGSGSRYLHVNAALHANEWLTSPSLIRFVEEYAAALAAGRDWHGHRPAEWYREWTLLAVPMANPDGVELVQEGVLPDHPYYDALMKWNCGRRSFRHWKANIRGVDLGDQFPAHWEEERSRRQVPGPAPKDYSGSGPLSEPESAALAALAERIPGDAAVSLHSQGAEIYWNYRGYEPP